MLAFGQQNYQDVVYLKNGSIIRGVISEQVPNQTLKIVTADGNVFVYQFAEVDKLTREAVAANTRIATSSAKQSHSEKTKGYVGIVDTFYGIGVSDYAEAAFCRYKSYFYTERYCTVCSNGYWNVYSF